MKFKHAPPSLCSLGFQQPTYLVGSIFKATVEDSDYIEQEFAWRKFQTPIAPTNVKIDVVAFCGRLSHVFISTGTVDFH